MLIFKVDLYYSGTLEKLYCTTVLRLIPFAPEALDTFIKFFSY